MQNGECDAWGILGGEGKAKVKKNERKRERGWSEGSERRLSFLLAGSFPAVIWEKEGR